MRNILIRIGIIIYFACVLSASVLADSIEKGNIKLKEAFILFYMASCPHCQRFDPILKKYAEQHRLPVLAYTLDGHVLPSFPDSVLPTQKEVTHFFQTGNPVVPTLFLVNFEQHTIIPVLQGEANTHQLDRRIQQIHRMVFNDAY